MNFTSQLKYVLERSESLTKNAVQSIDSINAIIDNLDINSNVIDSLRKKQFYSDNLKKAVLGLENYLELTEEINKDKFNIINGHKGSVDKYIKNLMHLRSFQCYVENSSNNNADEKSLTCLTLFNLSTLCIRASEYLSEEFQDILKNYSSNEQCQPYIDYLLNKVFSSIDHTNKQNDKVTEIAVFIPRATIKKLFKICNWLSMQESSYELYNAGDHCDIDAKLKFSETRKKFLLTVIKITSKMSSNESSAHRSRLRNRIGRMFRTTASEPHKALEYIALFAENLNFFLKMLSHEVGLIKEIFSDDETKQVLVNKLTLLVIENIQTEFEDFFLNACDYKCMHNNGHEVVREMINLILKVKNLKEKTNFLQANDMHSAFRFINFEMQLDELSAIIFKVFLDSVRTGQFNSYKVLINLNVHSFTVQTLQCLRIIYLNRTQLANVISIACSLIDSAYETGKPDEFSRHGHLTLYEPLNDGDEENDLKIRIYFDCLIDSLCQFLENERKNIEFDSPRLDQINFISPSSLSTFKMLLKHLEMNVFLLNNYDFVQKFLTDLNLLENLQKKLEIDKENFLDKACKVFEFISHKWTKLFNKKNSENANKRKKSEMGFMLKETLHICCRVSIENESIKKIIKEKFILNLKSIFKQFDKEILNDIATFINNETNDAPEQDDYFEKVLRKLFPQS
jgi:hypothetical protein